MGWDNRQTIRVYDDDNTIDIIEKVNKLLEPMNCKLVVDESPHDGFEVIWSESFSPEI